ncbi:MAG: universal stress protein [Pseudomonadota bacterium]
MFKKIMVPVDLDQPEIAERAMSVAKELAMLGDAEILVISIATQPSSPEGVAEEARLEAYLSEQRGALKMDGVLTLGGKVAKEIRYAAEEMGVDLIVMASHEPRAAAVGCAVRLALRRGRAAHTMLRPCGALSACP